MQASFLFLDQIRYQQMFQHLQSELTHKATEIQRRDSKITQLENLIAIFHDSEIQQNINIEEEVQCSLQSQYLDDRDEIVRRLNSLLKEREQQGVGLHLATLEKQSKMSQLNVQLQQQKQQLNILRSKLLTLEQTQILHVKSIEQLQDENNRLQQRNTHLEEVINEKNNELSLLRVGQQNLSVQQKNIIIRGQMSQYRDMYEMLSRQLSQRTSEGEEMKKIINNYDWKLFCLETELDLSNKEKKQYKYINDKNEMKMSEYEMQIKQLTLRVYNLEQDVKTIEDQNRYKQLQLNRKQIRIQHLLEEIEELKQLQEYQDYKQLKYRLREKDEELKEITNYLKEKIKETHEGKMKYHQLEKSMEQMSRKLQKIEYQNYELEQSIIQNEEIIQKQTQTIDQYRNQNEFINQKLNQISLINLLRIQEFQSNIRALQTIVKQKSSKINELSVEIIERQIQFNKKKEQSNEAIRQAIQDEQIKAKQLLDNANTQLQHLDMVIVTKDKQVNKLMNKVNQLQGCVKEKQKIIQFVQSELKGVRSEVRELKILQQQQKQKIEQLKDINNINEQKIKILKKQSVDNIETELNYQFQIDSLKKTIASLQAEKAELVSKVAKQENTLEQMKKEVRQIRNISKQRMQEMMDQLENPPHLEQTTTFQVLEDDDEFQVIGEQKLNIRKKIMLFSNEVDMMWSRYD